MTHQEVFSLVSNGYFANSHLNLFLVTNTIQFLDILQLNNKIHLRKKERKREIK